MIVGIAHYPATIGVAFGNTNTTISMQDTTTQLADKRSNNSLLFSDNFLIRMCIQIVIDFIIIFIIIIINMFNVVA